MGEPRYRANRIDMTQEHIFNEINFVPFLFGVVSLWVILPWAIGWIMVLEWRCKQKNIEARIRNGFTRQDAIRSIDTNDNAHMQANAIQFAGATIANSIRHAE